MKKLLTVCVCLAMMLGAVAFAEEAEPTYLAFVSDAMPKDGDDPTAYEKDMIYIHSEPFGGMESIGDFWLMIPEDGPAVEEYHKQGVRFTLSQAPEKPYTYDDIVTPESVEIIGAITGEIVESGDDYLVTKVYDWGEIVPDAPTQRLICDNATEWAGDFNPGDPVRILYDPATDFALYVTYSNG